MKVLIACEFSGIVREAFKVKGHDAWSCDLLLPDISGNHIQRNVAEILDDGWDLMIAFPPCTYLCKGGNNWMNRRPDLKWRENRETALNFFLQLISANIKKICVENPIGCVNTRYRKPDQIIYPWMFGHGYRKDICLWLKNLPKLIPKKIVSGRDKLDFWSTKRNPGGKSIKSITFQGVADAMADQWG